MVAPLKAVLISSNHDNFYLFFHPILIKFQSNRSFSGHLGILLGKILFSFLDLHKDTTKIGISWVKLKQEGHDGPVSLT